MGRVRELLIDLRLRLGDRATEQPASTRRYLEMRVRTGARCSDSTRSTTAGDPSWGSYRVPTTEARIPTDRTRPAHIGNLGRSRPVALLTGLVYDGQAVK